MSVFHLNRRMLSDLNSVNEASLNHLCSQYWFMIIIKVTGPRNKPSQVLSTLSGTNPVKHFLLGQGYIRSSILLFSLDDTWSCLIYLITQNISPAVRNFGGMVEWTVQSIQPRSEHFQAKKSQQYGTPLLSPSLNMRTRFGTPKRVLIHLQCQMSPLN